MMTLLSPRTKQFPPTTAKPSGRPPPAAAPPHLQLPTKQVHDGAAITRQVLPPDAIRLGSLVPIIFSLLLAFLFLPVCLLLLRFLLQLPLCLIRFRLLLLRLLLLLLSHLFLSLLLLLLALSRALHCPTCDLPGSWCRILLLLCAGLPRGGCCCCCCCLC